MKNRFLLLAGACLLTHFAIAQSTPTRSFMIGPTVGIDKTSYINDPIYNSLPSVNAPTGMFGGVDASYLVNRWLFGAKLLYQKQTYQATYPTPEFIFDYHSPVTFRTDTDYHLLSMPLSAGYRLTAATRLQWFLGGTVEFNYSAATGQQTIFSEHGIRNISDNPANPILDLGYGVQTTLRYAVTPQLALQLEPAVRYNSKDGYLIRYRDSYQFRSAFSVLVKL